jgi:hypothetical protein
VKWFPYSVLTTAQIYLDINENCVTRAAVQNILLKTGLDIDAMYMHPKVFKLIGSFRACGQKNFLSLLRAQ